ncbi:MAG: hypothetical protein IPO17_10010 [Flavobacteriales bacterium]|nr:hypothetical protein [Flavobacteriales bacterium]
MNPSPDIDSDLLASYVAGEADAAQQAVVEQWAASAPEHARELERLRSVWSWSEGPSQVADVDVDSAWKKVSTQMDEARVIPWVGRRVPVGHGLLLRQLLLVCFSLGACYCRQHSRNWWRPLFTTMRFLRTVLKWCCRPPHVWWL